ncbi:hypothetical protein B0H13DRAFT_2023860 [Mycena leptocephala]|nr:hypothetical protein B0H13DRAFT_2023860 [Mycena leptocephala]
MATTSRKRHRRPLKIQSASNRYKGYDAHLVRWLIQKAKAYCTPIVGSRDPKYHILLKEYLTVSKELAKRGVQPPLNLKFLLNAIVKLRTRCYQWYQKTMPNLYHRNKGHLAVIQKMRQVRKVWFNTPLGYDTSDTDQDEPAMDLYQHSSDDQDETMVDSGQDSDTEEESSEPDEDETITPRNQYTYSIAVSNQFTHTERVQGSAASNQYTYTDEDESIAASDQDIEEEEIESSAAQMNPGPFIATTSNQDSDTDEDEDDCITASHQYPAYYCPFTVKDESIAASNQYAHGRSDRHNYTDDESENTSDPDSEIEQEECSSASEDVDDEDFSDETEEP